MKNTMKWLFSAVLVTLTFGAFASTNLPTAPTEDTFKSDAGLWPFIVNTDADMATCAKITQAHVCLDHRNQTTAPNVGNTMTVDNAGVAHITHTK